MLGSVARRDRLPLWALLSFVAVLGFAVSTLVAKAAHDDALDRVVQRARVVGNILTNTVPDKELADPIKGASYDKLATRITKTISADAPSIGVTVWSSHGRVLFSLQKSLIGTTDRDVRPIIADVSNGSGSYRITDGTVRGFAPVPRVTNDRVVVVEVDEPLTLVESRVGDLWNTLRAAFVLGLAASLLLLGLSFASSLKGSLARAHDERPEDRERHEASSVSEPKIEQPVIEQPVAEQPAVEEPAIEEPAAADQPAAEEPVREQPEIEQPAAAEELVTSKPTASFTHALAALEALRPDLPHTIRHDGDAHGKVPGDAAERVEGGRHAPEDEAADVSATPVEAPQAAAPTAEATDGEAAALELMKKRREELKARAAKAELRVKKQEAELQEAGSGPRSEQ